jgi:hypothetical protein
LVKSPGEQGQRARGEQDDDERVTQLETDARPHGDPPPLLDLVRADILQAPRSLDAGQATVAHAPHASRHSTKQTESKGPNR